jgi:hypothetical protein
LNDFSWRREAGGSASEGDDVFAFRGLGNVAGKSSYWVWTQVLQDGGKLRHNHATVSAVFL